MKGKANPSNKTFHYISPTSYVFSYRMDRCILRGKKESYKLRISLNLEGSIINLCLSLIIIGKASSEVENMSL